MGKTRLFVGGLDEDVRERDVERFFKGYGHLDEISLKNGFCFVEFSHSRDAEDAIHDLDGKKLLGARVLIQNARSKPRGRDQYDSRRDHYSRRSKRFSPARRTSFRVIVENLSSRIQWQDLKDFLTRVGKVTYAKAHNICPNQGMVEFDTRDDMKRVIKELDGAELNGRHIVIKEADRMSRSRSRSSGRRSKSHSRSRSPIERTKSRSRSSSKGQTSEGHLLKPLESCKSPSPIPEVSHKISRQESEERSRTRSSSKQSKSRSRSPLL